MATTVGEARSNWLSDVIKDARADIKGGFLEQRRERNAIIKAIQGDERGNGFSNHPDLPEVVTAALALANHLEREEKRQPNVMTASPAIQASWLIFDEMGVDRQ